MHGYDIIDHNALNPEIGSWEEYERFAGALKDHGMGQVMDLVPNHMAVMGDDNLLWLDVLENGQASVYADFFDIDWQPGKPELRGKVHVPVLDDQYGNVLEKEELKLVFDSQRRRVFGILLEPPFSHRPDAVSDHPGPRHKRA